MAQTLYRKYRSQDFDEMLGQDSIVKVISEQVKKERVGHAYVFSGPRGTGKTSMARLLAKAVNCENRKGANPCRKCSSCKSIEQGKFLDLIEIDAASNRGIDEIRKLRERVGFSPSEGKFKVYIIDEVHMLTKDAFNALLKTLEEPPEHVIFILATTEPHKIPLTILSRCQRFNFTYAPEKAVHQKLKNICKEEKVKFSDDALLAIVNNAGGSFRDAESILDKVLGSAGVKSDKKVDLEDIRSVLGLAEEREIEKFIFALLKKDVSQSLKVFEKFSKSGINIPQFLRQSLEYTRGLLLEKVGDRKGDFGLMDILKVITELSNAEGKVKRASVETLPVEVAIVKICNVEEGFQEEKPEASRVTQKKRKKKINAITDALSDIPKKLRSSEKKESSEVNIDVELDDIKHNWSKIVSKIEPFNHHLFAFFKKATPQKVEGDIVILEVPFRFHKMRIESQKGKEAFGRVSEEVLGAGLRCRCNVVESVEEEADEKNVSESIGGGEVVLEVLGDMID